MKIYHLLFLAWVIVVTLWMFNQTRPKRKPTVRKSASQPTPAIAPPAE